MAWRPWRPCLSPWGVTMLVLAPEQEQLATAKERYEAARQAQIRQKAAKKTLVELAEVWATLPPRKEFATLAAAISELARADRVSIQGMTYSLQKAEEGMPIKASLTFRPQGEYAAIRRFIHRLETTGSYLYIESLDASRATGSRQAAAPLVVFNVRLVTFLRPDPPPAQGAT
ncbi:MAG: hypothetical protein ACREIK_06460 [Nitrospiraceae bacterium]